MYVPSSQDAQSLIRLIGAETGGVPPPPFRAWKGDGKENGWKGGMDGGKNGAGICVCGLCILYQSGLA